MQRRILILLMLACSAKLAVAQDRQLLFTAAELGIESALDRLGVHWAGGCQFPVVDFHIFIAMIYNV